MIMPLIAADAARCRHAAIRATLMFSSIFRRHAAMLIYDAVTPMMLSPLPPMRHATPRYVLLRHASADADAAAAPFAYFMIFFYIFAAAHVYATLMPQ